MKFYKVGAWISVKEKLPQNREDKFYCVSMVYNGDYKKVSDEFWRYFNNHFEFYSDGVWKPLSIPNWKIDAYAVIKELEPYPYYD